MLRARLVGGLILTTLVGQYSVPAPASLFGTLEANSHR
jgi:hypothetical protein